MHIWVPFSLLEIIIEVIALTFFNKKIRNVTK